MTLTYVVMISISFLDEFLSANAPKIGDKIAAIIAEIDMTLVQSKVPLSTSSTMYVVKNALYIKVTMIVENGWLAKSYSDHANILFLILNITKQISHNLINK